MTVADSLRRWVTTWWAGDAGALGSAASIVALPLEIGFRMVSGVRNLLYDHGGLPVHRADAPVISIGNLTIGGTGKTPVSAWIAGSLRHSDRTPWILLRGYGADEVLVHRELNPDIPLAVGGDRTRSAAEAVEGGADCLVLDDGFQHRRLHRDLDIVLIAAEQWADRRCLLPRGPWRESERALRRAGVILVTRKSASAAVGEHVLRAVNKVAPGVPAGMVHLALAEFVPLGGVAADPDGQRGEAPVGPVTAVSSLGNPAAFEAQLAETAEVMHCLRYPDHHDFTQDDVSVILERAAGTTIVMTRKEAVKLRGKLPPDAPALVAGQIPIFDAGQQELEAILHRTVRAH